MRWLLVLLVWCAASLPAAQLTIDPDGRPRQFDSAQLLARADAREVTIADDVAFKRTMRFRAVPLLALLPGLHRDDSLRVTARDGFSAQIPLALIDNRRGSTAWLAVEDPAHPWPALPGKQVGAGPFYLVWTRPQAAGIGPEQWPYQIVEIARLAPVAQRFPMLLPDPAIPADSEVRRGLAVFQSACMACHRLNGGGDAQMGPDLNLPYSPTEYLREDFLRAYIRDPQSLRRWPQARMPGFDARVLPDAGLEALLAYLRHMAGRKPAPNASPPSPQP